MESGQVQELREAAEDSPAAYPDWDIIHTEITCSLCEYNLRGLSEPRCPECGHQFEWDTVLDASARVHPWLFEHQRRRNTWSFFQTVRRSLRPRLFWKSILPIHEPVVRRLVVFSILLYLPIVLAVGINLLRTIPETRALQTAIATANAREVRALQAMPRNAGMIAQINRQYGSLQAYINTISPIPTISQRLKLYLTNSYRSLIPMVVQAIAWPIITVLTLLIFRTSLRQARIKTNHLIRCVIYSEVPCILMLTLYMLARGWGDIRYLQWNFSLLMLLGLSSTIYCLCVAYRLYLRFPHAIWTVLASQLIFILVDVDVQLNLTTGRW